MGGGKTTQTSENKIDPALMALYNQNYARATAIADTPFQPYTGERVAGLTSGQRQAYGMVSDIAAGRTGADTLDQAKTAYGDLMKYAPAQIAMPGAVQAGGVSASPVTAGMLRDTDLSAYMNPYTQTVIDTSLADLSRARDVQRVADNQSATRANAFGGSRQGVADSLTNEAYLRNVSSTSANLRNAGYDKAVSAAIADLDRALGASQFNSGQAYDAQKTNVANRLTADQFNTGIGLDVARTNAANDLAGANFRLNAAGGLAGLSNQELSMALARAGALGAAGEMEQTNQQAQDNAAYEEFMRMIGYPAQQQQLRNEALGMMPKQSTTTTTSSQSMGFGDIFGAAMGGLKAAGGLGWL